MEFGVPGVQWIVRGSEALGLSAVSRQGSARPAEVRGAIHLRRVVVCTVMAVLLMPFHVQIAEAQSLANPQQPVPAEQGLSGVESKLSISESPLGESLENKPSDEFEEPTDVAPGEAVAPLAGPEGPSAIEMLVSGRGTSEPGVVSVDLKQFGYDVFRQSVSTFAPVTNVPVGPDYVIGPGDTFAITMWGRADAQYTVAVDRNGQVTLPEIGALSVSGMTFGQLESYLQHQLARKFTDVKTSISMGRLRTVRVFVVGEATTPGAYTVSSLSTAINAFFAAGGPSKNGSLRRIRLSRVGAVPVEIDLYDFLLGGDKSSDQRLQDGDTIFVPLIGPVVGVAGNVKRPAIYEMTGPMTLNEVLDLAGGITFAGWLQRVQVERVEDHQRRIVVDFDISRSGQSPNEPSNRDVILQDGDLVKVFAVASGEQDVVHLAGHVLRPGTYEWKPGMRLSDILTSHSVLLSQPNLDYGQIERLVPPDLHMKVIPFDVGKLLAGDESQDMELTQHDTIRLYRWDQREVRNVRVSGMVFDPNQYRLVADMRVSDLVDMAGGLTKNAYHRMAEVTRRHIGQEGTSTEKIDINLEKALAGDPEHDILLSDYDHLVVRPIPELDFDRAVEILDEVKFPGTYPIRRGETLSSLITRAGGYTERAYLRGAVFTRESAREVQRKRLDQMVRQVEESVLASTEQSLGGALDADTVKGQQAALEAKKELLARLRANEITGRVVVKLSPLEEFRGSRWDLELEDGDILAIPQTPGVVHVLGEVYNETSLLYEKDGSVNYYLRKVGGMTEEADKKHVSVIKTDGTVISKQQDGGKFIFWDNGFNQWFFGGFMNSELEPGDTIVVPRKLDRFFWLRTTKDITQIVFQIAVAAGVVFAI